MSWALSIAVLVSMVISLTLIPVFAAKFLAGRPMPGPGPIYTFVADIYEKMLAVALRMPKLTLALSVAAVGVGVVLYTGVPDYWHLRYGGEYYTNIVPKRQLAIPTDARTEKVGRPYQEDDNNLYHVVHVADDKEQREKYPDVIPGRYLVASDGWIKYKTEYEPLLKGLQTGLMPAMDEGAFIVDYWAPSGTPLSETEKMARAIEEILSKNPDVDAYVRRTGAELGMFATQTSRGDIQVVLRSAENDPVSLMRKPVRPAFTDKVPAYGNKTIEDLPWQGMGQGSGRDQIRRGKKFTEADPKTKDQMISEEGKAVARQKYRRRPVDKVMEEIEDEIKDNFAEHQLKVELVQVMQDELNDLSGASKPVEVKLFGPDHNELRRIADEVVGDMLEKKGKGRGIKEVNSNVHEGNPDLMIVVDDAVAVKRGLTTDAIERQLRAIFMGQVATQVRESAARITDVRVRYPNLDRFGALSFGFDADHILKNLPIMLPDTALTPTASLDRDRFVALSSVAKVKRVRTPDEQYRENQQPAMFVTADLNEEEAGLNSVVADIRQWMGGVNLPAGYHWELGGHYLHQQQAFRSLLAVMVVAIFLVFIMLAFQFRSVVLPMLIFLTQPLSLVSGLFALWLTNTPLNISSYMGAILLIGLDMKNGILLVEYIQQLRGEGMALRPALLLAGRTRFRPILMTSLAAILGLLPLALGIGPGAQMQQPLAIMVIGGLTANMLFTRLVIPVGYLVLEERKGKAVMIDSTMKV